MEKETVVVCFIQEKKNLSIDLELPLYISAKELIQGLNESLKLGIDLSDEKQLYFRGELPTCLIRGNRPLSSFGLRDGSRIIFSS